MPTTIKIEGVPVTVDDSFLQLSPEEQNATVDEIASSMRTQPTEGGFAPRSAREQDYSPEQMQAASREADVGGRMRSISKTGMGGAAGQWARGGSFGLSDEISGAMGGGARYVADLLRGKPNLGIAENISRDVEAQKRVQDEYAAQHPILSAAMQIGGGLSTLPVGPGATPAAPMTTGQAIKNNAIQGAVYGAGEGTDAESRASGAALGFGLGGAAGGLLNVAGNAIANRAAPTVNPAVEAAARQGLAMPGYLAGGRAQQALAGAAKQDVLSGHIVSDAADNFISGIGNKASEIASGVGAGSVQRAGEAAKDAINRKIMQEMPAETSALYQQAEKLINPKVRTPLNATQTAVADIMAKRGAAARSGTSSAVAEVADAIARPGGLTYEGLKDLRTSVGEYLKPNKLPQGMDYAEAKRIYGALSDDLHSAVQNAGGAPALAAWKSANDMARVSKAKQNMLAKIVGTREDAAGEKVFERIAAMASNGSRADLRTLQLARQAMKPSEWNEVASAVVAKLGRATPDAEFSADRFVTQWAKMSSWGKAQLFGSSPKLISALDDIATVAKEVKKAEQFSNRSNTGRVATGVAYATSFLSNPVMAISAALGSHVLARILSRPATAQATAKFAKAAVATRRLPPAAATTLMSQSSSRLGVAIANELGMPQAANDIGQAIMGSIRSAADDPEAPRKRYN